MRFASPLIRATLIKRYKRFLADVRFESGETTTAHVANPGTMIGLAEPGMEVWLSPATNPARKLAWNWELVRADGHLVGINTSHPNGIVAEALARDAIPEFAGYPSLRREVKYGLNSRIDILLEAKGRPPCYVEIKNVHMKCGDGACFPDSVTVRGAKHLAELSAMVAAGCRAAMLYLVQRADCSSFGLAQDIDPNYVAAFDRARAAGVEMVCYSCRVSIHGVDLDRPLPIRR